MYVCLPVCWNHTHFLGVKASPVWVWAAELAVSGHQHPWAELSRPRNRGKTIMTKGPTESLVDDHPKLPCNWVWMVNPVYHQKTYLTKENRSWATAIYRADMEAAFSLNNWTRQLLPSAFPWTQIWYGTIWTQRLASALRLSLSLIKFYTCSHVVWHSINFIYEITQSMDLRDVLQVWPFSFFFPES